MLLVVAVVAILALLVVWVALTPSPLHYPPRSDQRDQTTPLFGRFAQAVKQPGRTTTNND